MIEKLSYLEDAHSGDLRNKINEIIDFLNNLPLVAPPMRYFKTDYGYVYEVDEFGNPMIPPGGPR